MVGHQAIGPNAYARATAPLDHEIEIGFIITFAKEGWLAAVASLGNKMRITGHHNTRESGHIWSIGNKHPDVKNRHGVLMYK